MTLIQQADKEKLILTPKADSFNTASAPITLPHKNSPKFWFLGEPEP